MEMEDSAVVPRSAKLRRIPLSGVTILIITFATLTGLLLGYDLCIIGVILDPVQRELHMCPPEPRKLEAMNEIPMSTSALLGALPCPGCAGIYRNLKAESEAEGVLTPSHYQSCPVKQLFVSLVSPGAVVGSLCAGLFGDWLGRRPVLIMSDVFIFAGAALLAAGRTIAMMLIGRILLGLGVGVGYVVVSTYLSEVAPDTIRGAVVACQEVAQCLGCLLAYAVAATLGVKDWRMLLVAAAVVAAAQAVGVLLLPESPRWYMHKGRAVRAWHVCRRLEGLPIAEQWPITLRRKMSDLDYNTASVRDLREARALETMENMLEESGHLPATIRSADGVEFDLVRISKEPPKLSIRQAVLHFWREIGIATGCAAAQNLTSHTALLYYAPELFSYAGIKNPYVAGLGVGGAKVLGILIVILLVERVGRKRLLLLGSAGCAVAHATLGVAFGMLSHHVRTVAVQVSMFGFMFAENASWAGLMYVVAAEVLPSSVRALGMGLTITTFWTFAFLNLLTFELFLQWWGFAWTFTFFALTSTIAALFAWRCVPDLTGQSLEEIAAGFEQQRKSVP